MVDLKETNWQMCLRMVDEMTKEEILERLVLTARSMATRSKDGPKEAWSYIGKWLGHGSGVSQAIVEKFTNAVKEG